MDFNESQSIAIEHGQGPMLVLAGPGSGKTLVITNRIQNLIEKHGIDPSNILVITFTKAAAEEMKQRFHKLMNKSYYPVNFGTFHAIFFRILKYAYHYNVNNIVREDEKHFFLKECIHTMQLDIEDESDFLQGIVSEISKVKNERIPLEHYYSSNCSEEIFRNIFQEYDSFLRRKNQIDFDDMLVQCFELFQQRKDILQAWQQKYKYILIDEFQDINRIQYEIIRMLAMPDNNLFIVGDDDQSIYRFRGADPKIMLNYEKDYPLTQKVLLNLNYRCSATIVRAAINVINNNKERFHKEIQALKEDGSPLIIQDYPTFTEENQDILNQIKSYRKKGYAYQDIAVLFRTNTQPRLLVQKLMEYNIPFKMKDSIPNIYEHWIVKNLLCYIRIALGSSSRSDYFQIINKPNRYLSRDAFLNEQVDINQLKKFYYNRDWMIDRINKLEYDLQMLKGMSPYAAIKYIRKGIGYDDYLKDYAQYRRIKEDELFELLEEVQETAAEFPNYEQWFHHMDYYGKELREQSQKQNQVIEAVTLSTMHASKGLEYKIVFIMDANEGITPHHKSMLEADLEEERRMFYVSMTRAKEYLHIYSSRERYNKELKPSRFIGELQVDITKLQKGNYVLHKTYGKCLICQSEKGKIILESMTTKKHYVLDIQFCITNQLIWME